MREERFSAPKTLPLKLCALALGHFAPLLTHSGSHDDALLVARFSARTKSTVLELAPACCTSHQSNFFVAPCYRAPCSAKQNLNLRARLELEALAASRSAAPINHVPTFPLHPSLASPEKVRLRRFAHHCSLSISNRYTAIRISRKHNENKHSPRFLIVTKSPFFYG